MYYALALFAAMLSAAVPGRRLPLRLPVAFEAALSRAAVVPLAVVVLVAAQHAFLQLLLQATYAQRQVPAFMAEAPIRFISGLRQGNVPALAETGFAALVLLEACALLALYCGLTSPTRSNVAWVAGGTLIAVADAVVSRAATSADMYAYVGFTLLGTRAYAPPAIPFAHAYASINAWWHTPMVAAPYGPLWLALSSLIAACGHTLFAKIVALRLLGACALLGTAAVLAALKIPPRIVALIALNPALIFEFVANVHNDLFGVLLLLVAYYASMRGATRLAVAFAVAAALVKLPFLVLAALAFVPLPSRRQRFLTFAFTVGCGISLSLLAGGRPYVMALLQHVDQSTAGHATAAIAGLPLLVKVMALVAAAFVLASGVYFEGCAWALPALGAVLHPWYLTWALPYAVASHDALRNLAIALPVAMLLADGALGNGTFSAIVAGLAYLWLAISLARVLAARWPKHDLSARAGNPR